MDRTASKIGARRYTRQLRFEACEERALLATLTLAPTDDAYIDSASPGLNLGSFPVLANGVVDGLFGQQVTSSYMKFNVSSVPANATIAQATLKLGDLGGQTPATGSSSLLFISLNNDNWSESTITFANRPTGQESLFASKLLSDLGATFPVELQDIPVGIVQQSLASDKTFTIRLAVTLQSSTNQASRNYASKENTVFASRRPQLIVEFTVPPPNSPPTDIALSNDIVNENIDTSAGDIFVGNLSAVDPDVGDTHTFALVSGVGSADNGLFHVSGDQLTIQQNTVLDHELRPNYGIRIRTTDAGGLSYEEMMTIEVHNLIEVQTVTLDDGTPQRSAIRKVDVGFDQTVAVNQGAFSVNRRGAGGGPVGVSFTTNGVNGKTVATLMFSGSFVDATGSLFDGNYDVRIDATKVLIGGETLDGDKDGTAGGDFLFGNRAADAFFVVYGNVDGDNDVDGIDFAVFFIPAFGSTITSPNYRAELDHDGDNDVDGFDFASRFIPNFGSVRDTTGYPASSLPTHGGAPTDRLNSDLEIQAGSVINYRTRRSVRFQ